VHALPPDQKAKLRAALGRFRDLPAAEREALRRKAARIGPERLEGLAGRDLARLRTKKAELDRDADRVLASVSPPLLERLSEDERAYLHSEAIRGFQRHLQRRLLSLKTDEELQKLAPEDRRRQFAEARAAIVRKRFEGLPDEERARIQALAPAERRAEVARLFDDVRADEAREFARVFERFRVQKHLALPDAERQRIISRWKAGARWHEAVRLLESEVGIGDSARADLAVLGPRDLARLRFEVEQTGKLPYGERRAHLEDMIHRMAGERSLHPPRRDRPVPPHVRALRERRMSGAPSADGPAAGRPVPPPAVAPEHPMTPPPRTGTPSPAKQ
jgi:hypothetical protein